MKTFPTAYSTEMCRTDGPQPVWVLRLTVDSVDYWLCDSTLEIPGFATSPVWPQNTVVNTLAWIKAWGTITEGISGSLGEYQVSEFSCTCLIDQAATTNMETLVMAAIEQDPAELYQWFVGCSDPPQRIFVGRVRDIANLSDTSVDITVQDESILLENCYIGDKISQADYPRAAAADVGTIVPIPFGAVAKAPGRALAGCLQTVLIVATTAAATSLTLTSTTGITAGMVLLLESEQVSVSSVGSSGTVTVSRGYGGTTAETHAKGTAVMQLDTQVYAVSARPVTALGKVWLRMDDDLWLNITSSCVRYTGQEGSQLAGYGSQAVISISSSGISNILDIIQLRQADTIAVSTGSHDHSTEASRTQIASNQGVTYGSSTHTTVTVTPTYTAVSGAIEQTNMYRFSYGGNALNKTVYVNGSLIQSGYSSGMNIEWSGTTTTLPSIVVSSTSQDVWVLLQHADRSILYVTDTDTSAAVGVAKSGTVTLSGAALSSYFGSGRVYADLTADSAAPATACSWVLSQAGAAACQTVGAIPELYKINGLIDEYQPPLYWLNQLAFQCGCWFSMTNGQARLTVRGRSATPRTIRACLIGDDGRRNLTRVKSALDDVINTITLLYNRDWSRTRSDTAYGSSVTVADSASCTVHGPRERPELFRFDFITNWHAATTLASLYLSECAARRWLAEFSVPLLHSDLEFGDLVSLAFLDNGQGTVLKAGHAPGNYDTIDTITLTVRY